MDRKLYVPIVSVAIGAVALILGGILIIQVALRSVVSAPGGVDSATSHANQALAFTMDSKPLPDSPQLSYNVTVQRNLGSYVFRVTGNGTWDVVYDGSALCFKKDTYKRTYCVPQKYSPIWLARGVVQGESMTDLGAYYTNLTNDERQALGALPNDELVAFLIPIEGVIQKFSTGVAIQEGMSVQAGTTEAPITLATIHNVHPVFGHVSSPSTWFNAFSFGFDVYKKYMTTPQLFNTASGDDSAVDELAQTLKVPLNNYMHGS